MTHKEIIQNNIGNLLWIKYRNKENVLFKMVVKIKDATDDGFSFKINDSNYEHVEPYDSVIDTDVNVDSFLKENMYSSPPPPPPVEENKVSYLDKFKNN